MAGNVSGIHVFANDVGPNPLKWLDDSYDTLTTALNTLSTFSNFYTDTGTTSALTVNTTPHQLVTYTDGLKVLVRVAATNTGASTLNVNGLGAQPILNPNGAEMEPGQLTAGSIVEFTYNAARQAWQTPVSSSQITSPFNVTNADGQTQFRIGADGQIVLTIPSDGNSLILDPDCTGALGCPPNQLIWDASGKWTFQGSSTLSALNAPFMVNDASGPTPSGEVGIFTVLQPPLGTTETCLVTIGPGAHGNELQGKNMLCVWGATDATVLKVWSSQNTVVGPPTDQSPWVAEFHGAGYYLNDPAMPPDYTTNPGTSNGVFIAAGTNTVDYALLVTTDAASAGHQTGVELLALVGSGSVRIGPAPNQLVCDPTGKFTLTGTATLPWPALDNLPDIQITNPVQGQALTYDQATGSWINATPISRLQNLQDVSVVGAVAGQVLTYSGPNWVNQSPPGYAFLNSLSVVSPQPADVLTWDGNGWIAAPPGQVAQFPLTSLTDVAIGGPLNRQVLTWDAPNNKWINASPPAPALASLSDVTLGGLTQGNLLSWDNASQRWVNTNSPSVTNLTVASAASLGGTVIANPNGSGSLGLGTSKLVWDSQGHFTLAGGATFSVPLAGLSDVALTNLSDLQVLGYNATTQKWVNASLPGGAEIDRLQTLLDVSVASPTANQVLMYNGTNWVNAAPITALANLTDVALGTKYNNLPLTYNTTTQKWTTATDLYVPGIGQFGGTLTVAGAVQAQNNLSVSGLLTSQGLASFMAGADCRAPFNVRDSGWNSILGVDATGTITGRGIPLIRYKTATTSRNNTTSNTMDPDLNMLLTPGTYVFTIFLGFTTSATTSGLTPGIRFQVVLNGGSMSAGAWTGCGVTNAAITTSYAVNGGYDTTWALWASDNAAVFGGGTFNITGGVTVTATGTFGLTWSQNVASADFTRIVASSALLVTRIS